jgi:hypothetical protein
MTPGTLCRIMRAGKALSPGRIDVKLRASGGAGSMEVDAA